MNTRTFLALVALLGLAACGEAGQKAASRPPSSDAAVTPASLPTYDSHGVVVSLEGVQLTLDHEGASAADLKAGRDTFKTYADVIAEAPITPGSRVSFRFSKSAEGLEVREIEARP